MATHGFLTQKWLPSQRPDGFPANDDDDGFPANGDDDDDDDDGFPAKYGQRWWL